MLSQKGPKFKFATLVVMFDVTVDFLGRMLKFIQKSVVRTAMFALKHLKF